MERNHGRLHRRHARDAFPDPMASAAAEPFALPGPLAEAEAESKPEQTIVSFVYHTQSPTFTGSIGGYITGAPHATTSNKPAAASPKPTPASDSHHDTETSTQADSSHRTSSSGLPASIVPTNSVASSVAIAVASSSILTTPQNPQISGTASAASSTSSPSPSKSGGMSAGGKAGLAIGILLLFGTVLALALFFFRKRRDAMKAEHENDEKNDIFAGGGRAASTRTTANAPRLSIRPVTQFLPGFGEKRQSRGNALQMASTPVAARRNSWDRPTTSHDANRNNPFGYHAKTIDVTNANGPAVVDSVTPGGEIVAGAAAGGLVRGASKRENAPKQIDFTKKGPFRGPPSPAATEFSMTSDSADAPTQTAQGAAIAGAGGPPTSAVHRVQLDFKPSMEDELELRAGQLIRLLHEYDDGWALCIRLDRSQQGVVPRTCLSTRPVKPRPQQNGPRGPPPPGMRVPQGGPMPPQGMNQGPPRAMSPTGNPPMNPQGRPMTPTGAGPQKPMIPQQGAAPHSPSTAQMQARRNTPPGPGPMNPVEQAEVVTPLSRSPPTDGPISRKPVGQAM